MTVTAPRPLLALVAALSAWAVLAGTALGHAALVSSSPAEGARVAADQVHSVTLTFDDDLVASKSQFELVDQGGATVATGRVGADPRTMSADSLSLAPGSYEARWTAATADGHITRGIVSFLATASASASASSASSSAAGSPSPSAPSASIAAIASPAPAADPASPSDPSGSTAAASTLAPITAAAASIALIAVLLLRRSRAA